MIEVATQRIRQLLHYKDRTGMDEGARGIERNRRAILTGSMATLARAVQVGSSLITIPLTLKYLGNERFGLWMTISSVLAMAAFADFGVGNGVLNTVAKAFGRDDMDGVRKAVSNGFILLGSIAIILIITFFAIFPLVNWGDFFRVVSPRARAEAGPVLAVFAICFALNISMDVVQRVQLGLQQGYRYSLWQLFGSTMGFVGVLCGIWFRVSLPSLVLAIAGAPIIATAMNSIHFFGFVRPDLRPSYAFVARDVISEIARLGGLFFVLQVVVAVSYSADNFIIARELGAVNVTEYSIPQRMFALITMMSGMLVAPLWPAYGEAISRGHFGWVGQTLQRSLLTVFGVTSAASCIILLLSHKLIDWWVGSRIHPQFSLLLGLAIWTVLACCGDALSAFLNGATIIRLQLVIASAFGVVCPIAKILLVHHFGIRGVPWATILSYTFVVVLPYSVFVPKLVRSLQGSDQKSVGKSSATKPW